jgi:tripartite-type tricarboxylate transporter receptor subunit TctC
VENAFERVGEKSMRIVWLAAIAALLGLTTAAQGEESWPQRQVTFLVPYTAGGSADVLARVLAPHMQATFGQAFVVENRAGAGGSTGTIYAARSAPDGYTVLVASLSSHVINQLIYKKLSLDTEQSFEPVSLIAKLPNVLCVRPGVPAHSVAELIAYMKANPDKLTFGSSGIGTSSHLSGELFKQVTGTKMVHAPFKSAGESANALAGGHVDIDFDNMSMLWPLAQNGNVRPIAVSSLERNPAAPDIPALAETLPGFEVTAWFGLVVPARTPKPIIDKLASEAQRILELPDVRKQLLDTGAISSPTSPEEFAAYIKSERSRWATTVRAAGISVD